MIITKVDNNFVFEFMDMEECEAFFYNFTNYINTVEVESTVDINLKILLKRLKQRTVTKVDKSVVTTLLSEEVLCFIGALSIYMNDALSSDSFKFNLLLDHIQSLLDSKDKKEMSIFEIYAFQFVAKHLECNLNMTWKRKLEEQKEEIQTNGDADDQAWLKRNEPSIKKELADTTQKIHDGFEAMSTITSDFVNDITAVTVLHTLSCLVEKGALKAEDAASEVGLSVEQFLTLTKTIVPTTA